jgi:transposase InsO family protein
MTIPRFFNSPLTVGICGFRPHQEKPLDTDREKNNRAENIIVDNRFENFLTRAEAKANIFEYIEVFYNPAEPGHSTLGYLSPVEFEEVNKVS